MLPDAASHRAALLDLRQRIVALAERDPRLVGVAVGGSASTGDLDAFSDLDVIVVAADGDLAEIMLERQRFAEAIGGLLVAFTGEHVGEPRLVIGLYGPEPLLHCDLKFVAAADFADRVEDPDVVWERGAGGSRPAAADRGCPRRRRLRARPARRRRVVRRAPQPEDRASYGRGGSSAGLPRAGHRRAREAVPEVAARP